MTLLAAGMVAAFAVPLAADTGGTQNYSIDFEQLNGSGVDAEGTVSRDGDQLTVSIQADNLTPDDAKHLQHIHGFAEGDGRTQCPPASHDPDGDGLLEVGEGGDFYGGFLASLTTDDHSTSGDVGTQLQLFPEAEDSSYSYERTFTIDRSEMMPLNKRVVVLHGLDLNDNGSYDGFQEISLPVACGELVRANPAS